MHRALISLISPMYTLEEDENRTVIHKAGCERTKVISSNEVNAQENVRSCFIISRP